MIAFLAISATSVFMATLFLFLGLLFCGHLTLFKTFKICSLQEELVICFSSSPMVSGWAAGNSLFGLYLRNRKV